MNDLRPIYFAVRVKSDLAWARLHSLTRCETIRKYKEGTVSDYFNIDRNNTKDFNILC